MTKQLKAPIKNTTIHIPVRIPRRYQYDQEHTIRRDFQRSALYDSETKLFSKHGGPEEHLTTLPEIKQWISDVIIPSDHWQQYCTFPTIQLGTGSGRRSACYKKAKRQICMPLWSRKEWILCHELAHLLTDCTHGESVPAHGSTYARHYIELVRVAKGDAIATHLQARFMIDGIKVQDVIRPKKIKRS